MGVIAVTRTAVLEPALAWTLQVFQQMQAEKGSLPGRGRAQPEIVIVGRFLRDIAARADDKVGHPKCLAHSGQGRRLHFDDIGVKVRPQ